MNKSLAQKIEKELNLRKVFVDCREYDFEDVEYVKKTLTRHYCCSGDFYEETSLVDVDLGSYNKFCKNPVKVLVENDIFQFLSKEFLRENSDEISKALLKNGFSAHEIAEMIA